MVDVSWMAKPCDRSSRSIMLRCPPGVGVWAWAGEAVTSAAAPKASHTAAATRKRDIVFLPFAPVGRDLPAHVLGREFLDLSREDPAPHANIREGARALNPPAPVLRDASGARGRGEPTGGG